jgi:HEAT repeat protein
VKALLVAWALVQEDPSGLLDLLQSDRIDERERAEERLASLGPQIVPTLRTASRSSDPELALRAENALLLQRIRSSLSPALRREIPTAEGRLKKEGPHAWFHLLREAGSSATLTREDLEPLFLPALDGAPDESSRGSVLALGARWNMRIDQGDLLRRGAMSLDRPVTSEVWEWMAGLEIHLGVSETLDLLRHRSGRPLSLVPTGFLSAQELLGVIRGLLAEGNPATRKTAFGLLRGVDGPGAREILRSGLEEPDPEVRRLAVGLAVQRGDRECSGLIARLLVDPDPSVRRAALEGYDALDLRSHSSRLYSRLYDSDIWVRRGAARLLSRWEGARAIPSLFPLLADPDFYIEEALLDAVRSEPAVSAATQFSRILESPNARCRLRALQSLVALNAPSTGPAILRCLADGDAEVRLEAIRAVVTFTSREAIPELRPLLRDPELRIAAAAAEALISLGDRGAISELLGLLASPDPSRREIAVRVIRAQGLREVVPLLFPALDTDFEDVDLDALELLDFFHAREAIPVLIPLLDTCREDFSVRAVRVLAHWEAVEAVPAIARWLDRTAGHSARMEGLQALGALGGPGAAHAVGLSLRDSWADVRALAARILGRLGSPGVEGPLEEALLDWDGDVRREATFALARDPAHRARPDFRAAWKREVRAMLAPATPGPTRPHFFVNLFRRPEFWARVEATPVSGDSPRSFSQAILDLAASVGLEVEDRSQRLLDPDFPERPCCYRAGGVRTVAEALEDLLAEGGLGAVLEEGRLVVLLGDASVEFWNGWLADVEDRP